MKIKVQSFARTLLHMDWRSGIGHGMVCAEA